MSGLCLFTLRARRQRALMLARDARHWSQHAHSRKARADWSQIMRMNVSHARADQRLIRLHRGFLSASS